ncbi:hypothetical protein EG327_011632 [Venturia inaequalis]|nr:hypothetical protein EG327_011632 [Venturia inaequalis]
MRVNGTGTLWAKTQLGNRAILASSFEIPSTNNIYNIFIFLDWRQNYTYSSQGLTQRPPNLTALARRMANEQAVSKLSQVYALLGDLTSAELRSLRISLLSTRPIYFDFLGLPLELREAIYRHALIPNSRVIKRKFGNTKTERHSVSLLVTCRQLYSEARRVMYREATFKSTLTDFVKEGYILPGYERIPFINYQKVKLVIVLSKSADIEYHCGKAGTLGPFLTGLVNMLIMFYDSRDEAPPKQLELKFMTAVNNSSSSNECAELNYAGPITDASWPCSIWFKVHIAQALATMRQELHLRAPFVTLISNMESEIAHIKTKFVDCKTVRFRDVTRSHQGTMHLTKKPHVVLNRFNPNEEL